MLLKGGVGGGGVLTVLLERGGGGGGNVNGNMRRPLWTVIYFPPLFCPMIPFAVGDPPTDPSSFYKEGRGSFNLSAVNECADISMVDNFGNNSTTDFSSPLIAGVGGGGDALGNE